MANFIYATLDFIIIHESIWIILALLTILANIAPSLISSAGMVATLLPVWPVWKGKLNNHKNLLRLLLGVFIILAVIPPISSCLKKLMPDSASVCKKLLGNYSLYQNYLFIETLKKDARSTALDGAWKETYCHPDPENEGGFILKGKDDTTFDIEAIIESKYEQLATVRYIYNSYVRIKKDGTLAGRFFETASEQTGFTQYTVDKDGNKFNPLLKDTIDQKISEIIKLRS